MAHTPQGFKMFEARITSIRGECGAGHQAGDRFKISCWDSGGLCGFFYHMIFADISVMQFGGAYPWAPDGRLVLSCPDRCNAVEMEIRPE